MLRVALLALTFATAGVVAGGSVAAASGPMADAGLDQTVSVGTTVHLDGTGSGYPDGELSGYEWTIRTPDGREIEPDCPDCERSRFTPSVVGRYEVTLTVTGTDGTRSTDTLYVYVEDAGPDVELSGDRTPDPDESVTYTATAESPDAQLEEIAWAVEDEIVAVRSLDGAADESELSLAFTEAETHRVQVVVRDSNGRTAYAQLYVQPQSESFEQTIVSQNDPTGCGDSTYAANNPLDCWGVEDISSPIPDSEPNSTPTIEPEEVLYQTDGYQLNLNLGQGAVDSSYMNRRAEELGIDNGENAPWNSEGILESTVEGVSTFLFGQERREATCEMTVGEITANSCKSRVMELENQGSTTNAYSSSEIGAYSEYGLENAERVRGEDPTTLEKGQNVEVTIVIQQEQEGLVEQTVETVEPTADQVRDTAGSIADGLTGRLGSESSTDEDSSTSYRSNGMGSDDSASSNSDGYLSPSTSTSPSSSPPDDSSSANSTISPGDSRPNRGLMA